MNAIRKRLRKLADDELRTISKAIDRELKRRLMETHGISEPGDLDDALVEALPIRQAPQRSQRFRRAA